ncbi:MAG: AAA-like domain-containing protein [Capsulimonadaceae bacterium]
MTLENLYRSTIDRFKADDALGAGLDWVDRILPHFTGACCRAVADGDDAALRDWGTWLAGTAVDGIREGGEPDAFVWRCCWLRLLVDTAVSLRRIDARDDCARAALAAAIPPSLPPFADFPPAFWRELVDLLAGTPSVPPNWLEPGAEAGAPRAIVSFPLVLAERMVVAGDTIDVLLADFVLENRPYGGGQVYFDPEQVATRCLDPTFLAVFAQAAKITTRHTPHNRQLCVRVSLKTRRPEDEVFLQKLIVRGPSGGGALASGLYALSRGHFVLDRSLAISFALSPPGTSAPDGYCHAVGGAYEKVRGCAKDGVRQLIVSDEQAGQVKFYGRLQDVTIIGVSSVADAFKVVDSAAIAPEATDTGAQLGDDGGVLPLGSPLYIERRSDIAFREALTRRPMIVLVKGARQIGKTSLLVRGVDHARRRDVQLVYVDLQSMGRESLITQKDLFSAVSRIFARELGLNVTMDDIYDERDGPNKNFENFLFTHALRSPVIWFMDEVDRLFEFDYYTDVFSLMRSWHNRRPVHPQLANLTLVLSYATETHLLIEDAYQSPFNVGVKVELEDFDLGQIQTLNERVGRPLAGDLSLTRFHKLVGGHPHLVCRGLWWMAHEHKSIDEFAACASYDSGPFGSHLRRLLLLTQNPELMTVTQDILRDGVCKNNDAFLHLRTAGVVVGGESSALRLRCEIYAEYLRRHLIPQSSGRSERSRPAQTLWRLFRGGRT